MTSLFEPTHAGDITLANRIAMAPLTRNRAPDAIPTELTATYYAQRATAGLIISEATAISPEGQGYADVPGLYGTEQLDGWKKVTRAVHEAGGKIVVQLWHVGRISHTSLQPGHAKPVAPSAIRAHAKTVLLKDGVPTFTDTSEPRALDAEELPRIVQDYRHAARNAIAAGFDGVEVHGANGYLIDQFLRDTPNQRTDAYGGSLENRARLLFEVLTAVTQAIGSERVGLRLSPLNSFNSMKDSDPLALIGFVADRLNAFKLAYLHVMRADFFGVQKADVMPVAREKYKGVLVGNMGYSADEAEAAIAEGKLDAVAFGTAFLANPDLPARIRAKAPLNAPDSNTFYAGGAKGYTDYPTLQVA